MSLGLKSASNRLHVYGSYFCIHSASLRFLVGAFHPFTFKVFIDMYVVIAIFSLLFFFFNAPVAYGGSQARGLIGATPADLHHSHSITRSEPHLRPIPQLSAMLDP